MQCSAVQCDEITYKSQHSSQTLGSIGSPADDEYRDHDDNLVKIFARNTIYLSIYLSHHLGQFFFFLLGRFSKLRLSHGRQVLPHEEKDSDPGEYDDGQRTEEAEDEESDVVAEVLLVLPGRSTAHPVVLNDVAAPAQDRRQGQAQAVAPGENYEADNDPPAVGGEVALKYLLCTELSATGTLLSPHIGVVYHEVAEHGDGHQVVDAGNAQEGEEEASGLTQLCPHVPATSGG